MLHFAAAGLVNAALTWQLEVMMFNCSGSIAHCCKFAAAGLVNAALMRQLGSVMFSAAAVLRIAAGLQQLDWSMLL
jgi:folate-dependent tRNA-U54 methylase TrmFO/GidA